MYKSIIVSNGLAYRTAGYRRPQPGEMYVSKSGAVSFAQATEAMRAFDGDRLIVRPLIEEEAPKKKRLTK